MDVKWGKHSRVLLRPSGKFVELVAYEKDAPAAVVLGKQAVVTVLSRDHARKLGYALIRVANDRG